MGDDRGDPHPDSLPEDDNGGDIESPPERRDPDPRPDIEQAVEARSDAVARGVCGAMDRLHIPPRLRLPTLMPSSTSQSPPAAPLLSCRPCGARSE